MHILLYSILSCFLVVSCMLNYFLIWLVVPDLNDSNCAELVCSAKTTTRSNLKGTSTTLEEGRLLDVVWWDMVEFFLPEAAEWGEHTKWEDGLKGKKTKLMAIPLVYKEHEWRCPPGHVSRNLMDYRQMKARGYFSATINTCPAFQRLRGKNSHQQLSCCLQLYRIM